MKFTAALFISFAALLSNLSVAKPVQFLAYGDMPYSSVDRDLISAPDGALYKAAQITPHQFVVHVGDIKAGVQSCSDALLRDNYQVISSLSTKPFIYTPGDNDWTDCDRVTLLQTFDELERLQFVRENFATQTPALANFKRQANQPENQSWQLDDVQFVTLHVVATNNGRRQILQSDEKTALSQVDSRDQLNFAWLDQHLPKKGPKAAVIMMQADIYVKAKHDGACTDKEQKKCDGLLAYRKQMDKLAKKRNYPILLVHGDTPAYCFSKRNSGLWHLNTPGDFKVLDIAQVTVEPESQQPFTVKSLLSKDSIAACPEISKD
ncbi:hypothetical protein ACFOEE_19505 [Pseudoalteromonas fenneropenaei]|uniref:Calcineurin-like phosphoesterase domain-containing protein n=1 Tax=Pseudoalteromonas fenneropenaei TaxID=1737459 RepID=A0ABV7CPV3_9GAMM